MRIAAFHHLNSGGSLNAFTSQVQYLRQFGHSVTVFTHSTPTFSSPAHYFHYLYHTLPRLHQQISHQINQHLYSACLIAPDHLTQSPFLLRFLKIPSLYYCPEPKRDLYESSVFTHDSFRSQLNHLAHLPIKTIDFINTTSASLIVTNSNYSASVLNSIYHRKIHTNYLGIDTTFFKPPSTPAHNPSILSVGTILPHKGFDLLIQAMSLLPPPYKQIPLVIVGNGGSNSYINYLKSQSLATGINLQLLTHVSNKKLLSFYHQATIFATPFHREPFGLVILEALATGLPVIASNQGGIPEIKSLLSLPNSRFSLHPLDPYQFASALLRHLTQPLQTRIPSSKLPHVFSWTKSTKQLESLLLQIAV